MKRILSVLLAIAMLAALCAIGVNADDITISYNINVKEDGTQTWYFTGLIPAPRYEAGWILYDADGNTYSVNGWEWDDTNEKYTVLNTALADASQAAAVYALADAGNLYAGIVDVANQGNGVVDANDCTSVKIVGDDGSVATNLPNLGWGEGNDTAVTRANVVTLEKVVCDADGQTWIFSGMFVGYEAGWELFDDDGNFYTVGGWAYDASNGYGTFHTTVADNAAVAALADAGKLTAGIVDVNNRVSGLVDANNSWNLVAGSKSTETVASEMWGECETALAPAVGVNTPDPTPATGDAALAVVAVVVAAAAGVVLVSKKH